MWSVRTQKSLEGMRCTWEVSVVRIHGCHRSARALFALVAAVALAAVTSGSVSGASAAPAQESPKAVAFTGAMAKLWEDHITWTRMVIVSFAAGNPNLKPAEARLLRNQVDLGNAIKPYYGRAAGRKLTSLLRTHILQAVTILQAAKAGDKAALKAALKAWYGNAHQIASFLTKANPENWPLSATTKMMNDHLKLTTQEAVAELGGHYAASVAAYDRVHVEILIMANTLSDGIIKQFPDRF
jgi:hypothetical protein